MAGMGDGETMRTEVTEHRWYLCHECGTELGQQAAFREDFLWCPRCLKYRRRPTHPALTGLR